MRLAMLSIFPPPNTVHAQTGGVAYYTHYLVHSIPADPQDTITILCNNLSDQPAEYEEGNVRVVRCFDKRPTYVLQVVRQLRRLRPDCLHIQQELSLYGNVLTAWLLQFLVRIANLMGIKTIVTLHAAVPLGAVNGEFVRQNFSRVPSWLAKFALARVYKPLCRVAAHIIVHEEFFRRVLIADYDATAQKVSVVPIGVQHSIGAPAVDARARFAVEPDRRVVLFMGYATGYKGIDLLLEGFSLYARDDPKAFLLVASGKHPKLGSDPEYLRDYERLQKKASELIPAGQYAWHGFVAESDFKYVFGACDVAIFPYTIAMSSSGPMALALGFDRPILASDALAELLPTRDLVFEPTPAALAAKLKTFFDGPAEFSRHALKMACQRSWERIGTETRSIYTRLASRAPSAQ